MGTLALDFDVVPSGNDPSDYTTRVKTAIRAMRRDTGMNTEEFAAALSAELGRHIRANKVTQWETGYHLPLSDVFLACITVSGAEPGKLGVDPRTNLAVRVNDLQRQLKEMREYLADGTAMPRQRRELELADAQGPVANFITATEAALILGVKRPTVYHFRDTGELTAYRMGTRTVFMRQAVEKLRERREPTRRSK